ncbi:unnamed protein product [Pylaiella littoralis]
MKTQIYRGRKLRLDVLSIFPTDAEGMFNMLSSEYDLFYVGIYKVLDVSCMYMHSKNVLSINRLFKIIESWDIKVSNIKKCNTFTGEMISEYGKKFKNGSKYQEPPPIDNTSNDPEIISYPPGECSLSLPERAPPTCLPRRVVSDNCKIIEEGIYKNVVVGSASPDSFYPVWSSRVGLWYPMMWIGPCRNIVSSKRTSVKACVVDELLDSQGNKCRLCETDAFMGTYSNSDVDHIIPLKHGGSSSIGNLQVLCVTCHRRKTALESKKVTTLMGDLDIEWEPSVLYLTNTHIHYMPDSIEDSSPISALKNLDGSHGLFKLSK